MDRMVDKQLSADEAILVDSVDFGIQESELLHAGLGAFAHPHELVQCNYQGPSNIDKTQGVMNHWRDWGQQIGVELRVPREYEGSRISAELAIQSYKVGEPGADPASTKARMRTAEGEVALGEFPVPNDGAWRIVEIDLGPDTPDQFNLLLDDSDNVKGPADHYGKRIAYIRLFAAEADRPVGD